MPNIYEQSPKGIIINSYSSKLKAWISLNVIKFKQTNQNFTTWKTSQSIII